MILEVLDTALKISLNTNGNTVANNNTWLVKIPSTIAPGNYDLRHEIIALHATSQLNGAQNYPFSFNLAISSNGTDKPAGLSALAAS